MKLGIMGGTFDPIHNAHLMVASKVKEMFELDKVLLMPTNNPPHKNLRSVSPSNERLELLRLAVEDYPELEVSTIELDRTGTTYTVDTLKQLRAESSDNSLEIFYIIGADVVFDLQNWKDISTVFELCSFIAVLRPGFDRPKFAEKVNELRGGFNCRISIAELPLMDICSTELRRAIALRDFDSLRGKMPGKVIEKIRRDAGI